MSDDISIKLGLEGEKEWKKALDETGNTLKQLNSGLKASQAEFAAHGNAMKGDAKSTALMRKTLETQKKYVDQLGKAVESSAGKYGQASAKTTRYVTAQNRAREAAAKLEKQLSDADREVEELGRDADKTGMQIAEGIGEGAEKAGGMLDTLSAKLEKTLGLSPGMSLGAGIAAVGAVAAGAVSAAVGAAGRIVVETEDRRRNIGFIQTNAKMGDYDWSQIADVLFEVEAILGDEDGAAEGVNNLMAAKLSQEDVKRAADVLMGAAITWGDETMKFEGLADGLQETIMSGKAAGPFAELLDRTGVSAEALNVILESAVDEEQRRQAVMDALETTGLALTKEKYVEDHADEVDLGKAEVDFKNAMTDLGKTLVPVQGAVTEAKTELVKAADKLAQSFLTYVQEDRLNDRLKSIGQKMEEWRQGLNEHVEGWIGDDLYDFLFGEGHEAGEAGDYTGSKVQLPVVEPVKPGAYTGSMVETIKTEMNEGGQEAGGELTDGVETGITEGTAGMETASKTAMQSVFFAMANSVVEDGNVVLAKAADFVNAHNQIMSQLMAPGAYMQGGGMGYYPSPVGAAGQNPSLQMTINMDGRKVANAVIPYVSGGMGRDANRAMSR